MIKIEMENYLRDLSCRQNRPVTQAELHLFINAKRYYSKDLEDFIRMTKDKKQIDLSGKITDKQRNKSFTEIENLEMELESNDNEINILQEEIEKLKHEKLFVYNGRLVLLDEKGNNLILKYKEDLFVEIVDELTKLWDWMDRRACYFKFMDNNNDECVINKEEVKVTIDFFNKINKIK